MPELPEATIIARQIDNELRGALIKGVHVAQPKCLNLLPEQFAMTLTGTQLEGAVARGKWIEIQTDAPCRLCLNLGMGGEILLHPAGDDLPARWAVRLELADGRQVSIGFWWFGYVHLVERAATDAGGVPGRPHPIDELGPSPLELQPAEFAAIVSASPRAGIKSILLDQRRISGIGNVTVQDPLWMAGVHPMRKAGTLSQTEVQALYEALRDRIEAAIARSGSRHEQDLHGQYGNWGLADYYVGYRTGDPCPRCGTPVAKIRSGSTSTYICPACQPL